MSEQNVDTVVSESGWAWVATRSGGKVTYEPIDPETARDTPEGLDDPSVRGPQIEQAEPDDLQPEF